MLCKICNYTTGSNNSFKIENITNISRKDILNEYPFYEDLQIIMPSIQIEDMNGVELFLFDILYDYDGEGWIIEPHENGYIWLDKIGTISYNNFTNIEDKIDGFGKKYPKINMEVVGNKYVNNIYNYASTPKRNKNKFEKYIENFYGDSYAH